MIYQHWCYSWAFKVTLGLPILFAHFQCCSCVLPSVFNVVRVFSALFGHFNYYSCWLLSVTKVVQLLPNVVQVLQMFIKCCRCYAWCFSQFPPLIPLFLFVVFSPLWLVLPLTLLCKLEIC